MWAITVLMVLGAAAVAFMVYVFVALCRESGTSKCHVAHILREPEQYEPEALWTSGGETVGNDKGR